MFGSAACHFSRAVIELAPVAAVVSTGKKNGVLNVKLSGLGKLILSEPTPLVMPPAEPSPAANPAFAVPWPYLSVGVGYSSPTTDRSAPAKSAMGRRTRGW